MNILNKLKLELKAAVEAGGPSEETFYKKWNEGQRKQYINDHPQSKFAQEKTGGNKPSETKPVPEPIQETTRKYTPQEESDLIQNLKKENIDLSDIESPTEDMIKIGLISKPNELKYLKDPVALKNLKSILDPENNNGQRDKILYNYMSTRSPYANADSWNKLLEVSPSCIKDLKSLAEDLKDSPYGVDQGILRGFQEFLNSKNYAEKELLNRIKETPHSIRNIKNPSEEMIWTAIKENGGTITYINNPTEEMQMEAIKQTPMNIMYIENPTEKVQLQALTKSKKTGDELTVMHYIENPTEKVQELLLEDYAGGVSPLTYIRNPSAKTIEYTIKNWGGRGIENLEDIPEKTQLELIKDNLKNIQYIKNPKGKVKQIKEKYKYLGQGRGDAGKRAEDIATSLSKELPGEFTFNSYDAGSGYEDSIMTYHSPDGKDIDLTFDGYAMEWIDPDSGETIHEGSDFDKNVIEDIKNFLKTKKKSTKKSWLRQARKAKNNLGF